MERQNLATGNKGFFTLWIKIRNCLFSLTILFSCQSMLIAAPLDPADVPLPLKDWIAWTVWEHDDIDCPFLTQGETKQCVWSSDLSIHLTDTAGEYSYG
ncbi:MAG: hypothetical protein KZQ79_07465, partial [Candidatus Thiodiazotropha sp. (ex Lucinoma borealis)]|nr:hypothetical protein [Candidatus Thiodiazotropha sp. (ex Lucinoma borealis)]